MNAYYCWASRLIVDACVCACAMAALTPRKHSPLPENKYRINKHTHMLQIHCLPFDARVHNDNDEIGWFIVHILCTTYSWRMPWYVMQVEVWTSSNIFVVLQQMHELGMAFAVVLDDRVQVDETCSLDCICIRWLVATSTYQNSDKIARKTISPSEEQKNERKNTFRIPNKAHMPQMFRSNSWRINGKQPYEYSKPI